MSVTHFNTHYNHPNFNFENLEKREKKFLVVSSCARLRDPDRIVIMRK